MSVDQRLRACPYCGGREFLCIQRAGIDIGQPPQLMGVMARKNLPNLFLQVTVLTCRGCGQLELFNTPTATSSRKSSVEA